MKYENLYANERSKDDTCMNCLNAQFEGIFCTCLRENKIVKYPKKTYCSYYRRRNNVRN